MNQDLIRTKLNQALAGQSPEAILDKMVFPSITADQVKGLLDGSIPLTPQAAFMLAGAGVQVTARDTGNPSITVSDELVDLINTLKIEMGSPGSGELMRMLKNPMISRSSMN